jgi:hypothetical protein
MRQCARISPRSWRRWTRDGQQWASRLRRERVPEVPSLRDTVAGLRPRPVRGLRVRATGCPIRVRIRTQRMRWCSTSPRAALRAGAGRITAVSAAEGWPSRTNRNLIGQGRLSLSPDASVGCPPTDRVSRSRLVRALRIHRWRAVGRIPARVAAHSGEPARARGSSAEHRQLEMRAATLHLHLAVAGVTGPSATPSSCPRAVPSCSCT